MCNKNGDKTEHVGLIRERTEDVIAKETARVMIITGVTARGDGHRSKNYIYYVDDGCDSDYDNIKAKPMLMT